MLLGPKKNAAERLPQGISRNSSWANYTSEADWSNWSEGQVLWLRIVRNRKLEGSLDSSWVSLGETRGRKLAGNGGFCSGRRVEGRAVITVNDGPLSAAILELHSDGKVVVRQPLAINHLC